MAIAYFNSPSGVAGDMILGSMCDAGLPFKLLQQTLKKIKLNGYTLSLSEGSRYQVKGSNFQILIQKPLVQPKASTLFRILQESSLPKPIKEESHLFLKNILATQKKVFHLKPDQLYFDGSEAIDVLIDLVGCAIGFDFFRFKEIFASPLPIHRCYTPDVVEALKGIPLENSQIAKRRVTITGITVLKTVVSHFGESPLHKIEKTGIGLGDMEIEKKSNALQLWIGEGFKALMIEANIDDMNPQWFDHLFEILFKIGVVDVFLEPIQMKKNRPGTLLKVIAPSDLKDKVIAVILKETTTLGVRYFPLERKILSRELKIISTRFGNIPVKKAVDGELKIEKWIPEYDFCKKIAQQKKIPIYEVYETIQRHRHHPN